MPNTNCQGCLHTASNSCILLAGLGLLAMLEVGCGRLCPDRVPEAGKLAAGDHGHQFPLLQNGDNYSVHFAVQLGQDYGCT